MYDISCHRVFLGLTGITRDRIKKATVIEIASVMIILKPFLDALVSLRPIMEINKFTFLKLLQLEPRLVPDCTCTVKVL